MSWARIPAAAPVAVTRAGGRYGHTYDCEAGDRLRAEAPAGGLPVVLSCNGEVYAVRLDGRWLGLGRTAQEALSDAVHDRAWARGDLAYPLTNPALESWARAEAERLPVRSTERLD